MILHTEAEPGCALSSPPYDLAIKPRVAMRCRALRRLHLLRGCRSKRIFLAFALFYRAGLTFSQMPTVLKRIFCLLTCSE